MLAKGVDLKRPHKRPHLRKWSVGVVALVVGVVAVVVGEGAEVEDVGVGVFVPLCSALLLPKPWPLHAWIFTSPLLCRSAAVTLTVSARSI